MNESQYLLFKHIGLSPSGKTSIWSVIAKESGHLLGDIKWYGRWRRYCFFSAFGTIYEQDCLRAIADFCENVTAQHRGRVSETKQPTKGTE